MDKDLDRKIIFALNKDGRLSNAQLARQMGISIATAAKRIDHLVKTDTIVFRAVPNPDKIGYNITAIIALDVDLTEVSRICDKLIDNVHISLIATTFGRFGIIMTMYFIDWKMMYDFLVDELYHIKGIRHVDLYFVSQVPKRNERVFGRDKRTTVSFVDSVDMAIIEALHKNGRRHYSSLVEKLGLSTTTISRRVASLCRRNVIKIIAIPNSSFFGYHASAYLFLHVDYGKIESVCQQLSAYKNIHLVVKLLNGYDLLVGLHFETSEMLYNFIREKVSRIEGISHIETLIRAEIRKRLVSILQ